MMKCLWKSTQNTVDIMLYSISLPHNAWQILLPDLVASSLYISFSNTYHHYNTINTL